MCLTHFGYLLEKQTCDINYFERSFVMYKCIDNSVWADHHFLLCRRKKIWKNHFCGSAITQYSTCFP
jgi:hypothetical protein